MKTQTILFSTLLLFSCQKNRSEAQTINRVEDSLGIPNSIENESAIVQVAIENEIERNTLYKLDTLNLIFIPIDSAYFYSITYENELIPDTTKNIQMEGGSFYVETDHSKLKFVCGKGYQRPCQVYLGYFPSIHATLVGEWGEGVYGTYLIDHRNDGKLYLFSEFDGSDCLPLVSPNHNFFVTHTSVDSLLAKEYYGHKTEIAFYDLRNVKYLNETKAPKMFTTNDWRVSSCKWIDNNTLGLEIGDDFIWDNKKGEHILIDKRYLKAFIKL